MTEQKRLRAILLPPMAWQPERDVYVSNEAPDPLEMYRCLSENGIDTILIDPGKKPLNPFSGGNTLLEALDPLRALRVLLSERRADIIISVFEGPSLPLLLLRPLLGFRVPIVLWDIGLTEKWKLRERVLNFVVPRADAIFVLSSSQQPYIAKRWGRTAGIEVLGQHIDTNFFTPAPPSPRGPILGIGEDIGRDFGTLIAAADGLDTDVIIKTRRIKIDDSTLPARVKINRERLAYSALKDLYGQSRFVVLPMHQVPNPCGVSSILEAGAMGRALIVSETASIRDFIVPGETCLTVPCGDVTALRAAIQRLIDEPETCERLGANGRKFIAENFSNPVIANRLAHIITRYRK